jgi:hypothetical protein
MDFLGFLHVEAANLRSGARIPAGMPSLLPEDLPTILRLNEEPHLRLQAISFFLLGIMLSAIAVRFLWNHIARDFSLPNLSFGRSLSLVLLWGLLFVVVLTMISGARELMTPGAWRKSGLTYTLAEPDGLPDATLSTGLQDQNTSP